MSYRYIFMSFWVLSVIGALTIQPLMVWTALLSSILFVIYWMGEINEKKKSIRAKD